MFERYVSHPGHLFAYSVPLLLLGAGAGALGWELLGVIFFIMGAATALWVVVVGMWQAHSDYTSNLAHDAITMNKIKDPDVWKAMGYDKAPLLPAPAARIEIPAEVPTSLPKLEFPRPPVSEPKMRLFANAVLRGASMSETYWTGNGAFTSPEIRKLKNWLEHPDRKYIVLLNAAHPRLGFVLTKRGTDFMLYYGDEEVKTLFSKRVGEQEAVGSLPANHDLLER